MSQPQELVHREFEKNKFENMIFFQNLVPGQPNTPFIDEFKKFCLEDEEDEDTKAYRNKLLENNPPTLSFKNKQEEDDFYKKQSQNCSTFCCGGVLQPMDSSSGNNILSEDRYKVSLGMEKLYEGTAGEIRQEMKADIGKLQDGSPEAKHIQKGLGEFNAIVEQRNSREVAMGTLPDTKHPKDRAIDFIVIQSKDTDKEDTPANDLSEATKPKK